MSGIEWIAVIATILSVFLLAEGKSSGWIFGIIGCLLYGIVFYQQKLYANLIIQIIFIVQGFYGISKWNQEAPNENEFKSKSLEPSYIFLITMILISVSALISCLVYSFTEDITTILDITLSIFSIGAFTLMTKRIIQAWFYWFAIDIGYIILFVSLDMLLSAILYSILLVLCINGYIQWKNKILETKTYE